MMIHGFIEGLGRANSSYDLADETHLYKGEFGNPGLPMCPRGWNRNWGTEYSIFRGNEGSLGLCEVCFNRAMKDLPGIEATTKYPRKLKKAMKRSALKKVEQVYARDGKISRNTRKYFNKMENWFSMMPYHPLRIGLPLTPPKEYFPDYYKEQGEELEEE